MTLNRCGWQDITMFECNYYDGYHCNFCYHLYLQHAVILLNKMRWNFFKKNIMPLMYLLPRVKGKNTVINEKQYNGIVNEKEQNKSI